MADTPPTSPKTPAERPSAEYPVDDDEGVRTKAHRLDTTPENQTFFAKLIRLLRSRLFWAKFWLVATGVWWGVCMQLLFYQGAGHPLAMLPNLDWYIGMMLVYAGRLCTPRSAHAHYAIIKQRHVLPIAVCDFLGTAGTTIGLELAGSAIFGIIYSSVTVWTALFTCVILRKAQSAVKMLGIATVVAGLTLPTLDPEAGAETANARLVFLGICLTFGGTLFYALEYTLCEQAFTLYDRPVDAKQLCFYTGAWGMAFTMIWMTAYTIPRWDELVVSEISDANGNIPLILLLFATHTINNGVHNAAWFVVCELESGVSTGLLMGVKAAALFLASALFFCNEDHPEQCMTPTKSAATCIVLVGTAVYYWPGDPMADCSKWLECYRMPRKAKGGGGGRGRTASTAPLNGHEHSHNGHSNNGDAAGCNSVVVSVDGKPAAANAAAVEAEGLESPQPPTTSKRRGRRRRKKGFEKFVDEEEDDEDEEEEEAARLAALDAREAALAARERAVEERERRLSAEGSTPGSTAPLNMTTPRAATTAVSRLRNGGAGAGPSPKVNGTPAELRTPNDECIRTPLAPVTCSSVASVSSAGGEEEDGEDGAEVTMH